MLLMVLVVSMTALVGVCFGDNPAFDVEDENEALIPG